MAEEPAKDLDARRDHEDAERPMGRLTVDMFIGAYDRLDRSLKEQAPLVRELRQAVDGVRRDTSVNERTVNALEAVQRQLENLNAIAYSGRATMEAVLDVRNELRTIRSTAVTSAHELEVIARISQAMYEMHVANANALQAIAQQQLDVLTRIADQLQQQSTLH